MVESHVQEAKTDISQNHKIFRLWSPYGCHREMGSCFPEAISRESKSIRSEMKRLRSIVENRFFQGFILAVIVFNSVIFGLQTSQSAMAKCGRLLGVLDQVCLAIFVIELVLKLIVYNRRFPRDAWNIFDFLVVSVSFVPDMGMLSSARILRVLRVFKLVSGVNRIFMSLAESNEYDCDDSLASEIHKVMVKTISQEDENFGNARFVRNLFEKSIQKQAIRLSKVAPITNKML